MNRLFIKFPERSKYKPVFMYSTTLLNILVVEDSPGDRILVTEMLKGTNLFKKMIFYAETLEESLPILENEAIDIILLDLSLPDSHGIDTYLSVKEKCHKTPVVILSGFSDLNMALDAITNGAQDYLIKGDFDEKLLYKTILYSIERINNLLNEEKKQQEITEAVISAQENERQEIGRELHDNINQVLASARLYLGLGSKKNTNENLYCNKADELVENAIKEIRALSHSLIPPSFENSKLLEALNRLLDTFANSSGLVVIKEFTGFAENDFPQKFKLVLYRIVQEQLNNIQKYARAKAVQLKLVQKGKKIRLIIKDDGVGYDVTKKSNGIGFVNINTRASLFNGQMDIVSFPGGGCELIVEFNFTKYGLKKGPKKTG